jgi:CelD/BcsL family acetyltransferase involved in cellulose biosynthesis
VRIIMQREIPQDPQLRDQWNALVHSMERPEVFYTWEWASAVGRAYAAALTPLLLLAYEEDALAGVVALVTDKAGKQFSFLTGTTADYCDFICLPERRAEFVQAAFGELAKLHLPILRLANLPADSATLSLLKDAAGVYGYLVFSRPAYQCARIALGSTEERRKLKQTATKRKAFRYDLKGLEKSGPVAIDHLRQWNDVEANLPRFVDAHVARCTAGGRASNLASAERQKFIFILAELLSRAGWLVLTRLLVGDDTIAWNYGFEFAGSWFYYQPTFDARWQKFSPGFCLLTKMVERACDVREVNLIDLGLGDEGYKDRFATGYRQVLHATITSSAAVRLREAVRYHAASAVKASPRLEYWVRRLVGRHPRKM